MVKLDIEIPTYCYDCPCHNGENGQCNITKEYTVDKRPFDCPMKEESQTADTQKVVHARWLHLGGDEWCCTNCGEIIYTERSWDKPTLKWCNECGAKMSVEENE